MSSSELALRPATELAELIRTREVSPVEVAEACLGRIRELDGRLGCFLTVCDETALAEARAAERAARTGEPTSPLLGVPFTLKDNVDTRGIRTTGGVAPWRERVPETDATVMMRLQRAGGILLGKVNLHELAMGVTSDNRSIGLTTHNPWDLERVPGGSSGGSAAAVASGLGPISIGSDTGGSIRGPAALCGVVGLKPTYGRVSRAGVIVNSWSLDHVGPLTRTVADTALALGVLAGYDPLDPSSSRRAVPDYAISLDAGVAGLRIGVLADEQLTPCWPVVREAYRAACGVIAGLGAELREVKLELLGYARQAQRLIAPPEIAQAHESLLREHPDEIGDDVRTVLELGNTIPAVEYVRGQRLRRKAQDELRAVFGSVDAILTPTLVRTAPRIGETTTAIGDGGEQEALLLAFGRYAHPFSLGGGPALSLPCGFDEGGLPIGLQIAGRPFDEATVLRIAAAYERSTPWHDRVPVTAGT